MKALGGALSLFIGIVLLVAAWQSMFPSKSDLMKEAEAAVQFVFNARPDEAVEHNGTHGNAVCGSAKGAGFIYVNGRLHTERSMTADQFEILRSARCRSPVTR